MWKGHFETILVRINAYRFQSVYLKQVTHFANIGLETC